MNFSKALKEKIESLNLGTMTQQDDVDYFDFSSLEGQISYIKKEKLVVFNDDFFNIDLRKKYATTARAGKVLKRLFPQVKDDIIRNKVALLFGFKSKIVETDKIVKYYNGDKYAEGFGSTTLNNSCMKYDECSEYIEFYEEIGLRMLVLFSESQPDKIKGRALIWPDVDFVGEDGKTEKVTFMDRIYFHEDGDLELFKEYAINHDYIYKKHQNYEETKEFKRNGEIVTGTLVFNTGLKITMTSKDDVKLGEIKKFPYTDTLMFFGVDGKLRSRYDNIEEYICRGQNTDGRLYAQRYVNSWDEVIESSDAVYSKLYKQFIKISESVESKYHGDKIRKKSSKDILFKGEIVPIDFTLIDKNKIILFKGQNRLAEEIFFCTKVEDKISFEECPLFSAVKEKIVEINNERERIWKDYKNTNWKENRLKITKTMVDFVDQFIPSEFKNFTYTCGATTLFEALKNFNDDEKEFLDKYKRADRFYLVFDKEDEIIQIGLPQGV